MSYMYVACIIFQPVYYSIQNFAIIGRDLVARTTLRSCNAIPLLDNIHS